MNKEKLARDYGIARSYYEYRLPVHEICAKMCLGRVTVYRILRTFADENPQIVEKMRKSSSPEDLSNENLELKVRLAGMEKELHDARMRADALDKMIDIAERLYNIPVRKKSGPKQ